MVPGVELTEVPPVLRLESLPVAKSPPRSARKRKHSSTTSSRRVAFASTNMVHIVARLDTYHPSDTWYTLQEYAMFEDDVRSTIRTLRQENEYSVSHICVRGLEKYRSLQDHEEKKLRERVHYSAILREQERQRRKGIKNTRMLRTLSKQSSKWAREKAILQGKQDAQQCKCFSDLPTQRDMTFRQNESQMD